MKNEITRERTMKQFLSPMACASTIGLLLVGLGGCSGGSTSASSTLTVAGDVPIVYAQRVNTLGLNPTDGTPFAAGGDLMLREKSSASAIEHNLTAQFTQGNGRRLRSRRCRTTARRSCSR
jgi:hypothetical protein